MLDALEMAQETNKYLRGMITLEPNMDFSCFADCSQKAERGAPNSPDPNMYGCRIRLC